MLLRGLKTWFQWPAWKQIMAGLLLGMGTGLLLGPHAVYLKPIGLLFIHAIQMLVVPVVVTAIVCAVLSVKALDKMGRVVSKALIVYALCMMISATIGIVVANLFGVGHDFPLHADGGVTLPHTVSFSDVLVSFVPTSPVAAFVSNNVIQILVFSFLFGVSIRLVGEPAKPVQDFFEACSKVVFQLCKIIIGFAPYGVFALIATVFGEYGLSAIVPLLRFVGAVYGGCLVLVALIFSGLLLFARVPVRAFWRSVAPALITAFTTSSSAATLPVTMRCARENLKIDRGVSDFLLPLGTTLNLNGLSVYLSVATIFAAHAFGIHLSFYQYVTLVVSIAFTAVGAAAIPGSALVVMGAVMNAVGIPLGALPLLAGVDRLNDMAQTTTNVAGDLFAAAVVAKHEGAMDIEALQAAHADMPDDAAVEHGGSSK
ncbi:MAG: hypothetical protein A3J38_00205 [Gammaproteobacteria bacterium RIFCSPHIGHO2_12_FULL_45_9]|nr:MAG: hypothetical protein A3J38_00205 [Gammaproteobacteria bacterium RIFCSPHIGHO2_12_FULL_45_9]